MSEKAFIKRLITITTVILITVVSMVISCSCSGSYELTDHVPIKIVDSVHGRFIYTHNFDGSVNKPVFNVDNLPVEVGDWLE